MTKEMQTKNITNLVPSSEWDQIKEQATTLIKSNFLPPTVKTPEQAIAIVLTGRELGISMMQSFRSINVIQGKPTLSANLMLALVQKSGQVKDMKMIQNKDSVTFSITRKGRTIHTETFGDAEAQAMGLIHKDNYKKQKLTMYKWRAVSAALRFVFGDILHGIYTPEELGADVVENDSGELEAVNIEPEHQKADPPKEQTEAKPPEAKPPEVKPPEVKPPEIEPPEVKQKSGKFNEVIEVFEIEARVGKNGKPFWWVTDINKERFFTFSKSVKDLLDVAIANKDEALITCERTTYGTKILGAEIVHNEQDTPPEENENEPNNE